MVIQHKESVALPQTPVKDQLLAASTGILGIMLAMDVLTTNLLLMHGGTETNPFMAGIVRNPLLHLTVKTLLLALVFLTARRCEARLDGSGVTLSLVLVGLYSIVVGNNLGVLLSGLI